LNGPIILNCARERLAREVFAYREPKSSTLSISPWLAMSLLQKSIRRGENEWAQRPAAALFSVTPDRLWRRCGAAAFEEIGVADLETVSLVTAALAGKRYRATIGGDWKVASFIVERMVRSPKCRASDDLLLVADIHPRFKNARVKLSDKSTCRAS
jgi:replication-associated recombination protein RarA